MERLRAIQAVRVFGFLLIFLLHSKMWVFYQPPQFEVMTGGGVILFLLLSGAIETYSLAHKKLNVSVKEIIKLISKKIVKYYPLYLLTNVYTISYYGPMRFLAQHDFANLKISVMEFVKVLLMIQPFTKKPFAYNGVSWFLAALMWFSILAIPMESVCGKIRQKRAAGWIFVLLLLVFSGAYALIKYLTTAVWQPELTDAHPVFTIWAYIGGIIVGNIVLVLREKLKDFSGLGPVKLFTAIELALIALTGLAFFVPQRYSNVFFLIYSTLFGGIVIVFMLEKGKVSEFLSKPFFVNLGNITFECYLIHQIIIHEYCQNNGWDGYGKMTGFLAFVLCLTITFILAAIINKAKVQLKSKNNIMI